MWLITHIIFTKNNTFGEVKIREVTFELLREVDKDFIKNSYLKNDELLKTIHDSLSKNNPVAIEWAAKYEDEWTLHFSLISGLDIGNDQIIIYNPYGYIENISIDVFIGRSTFEAYKNMPLFLNFGFAFGAFEKNTIFLYKINKGKEN